MMTKVFFWVRKYRAPLLVVGFWGVLLAIIHQYMTLNELSFGDMTSQLAELLAGTWYGPLLYIGLYSLRPLILFPASLLTVLGGSVFGLFPGFFYVLLAASISSLPVYAMGRWFAPQNAPKKTQGMIQRFIGLLRQNPFQTVITLRLLYLHYETTNFVLGNLKIPFGAFFVGTLIGNIPGTFAYTGIGASLEGDISTGEITLNPWVLGVSVAILIGSLLFSRLLSMYQQRRLIGVQEA